jgi:Leucine-rich repeat (LRR) protein
MSFKLDRPCKLSRIKLEKKYQGLDNLAKVEKLDLKELEIISIEPNTFEGLVNVVALHLNRNKISFLDPEIFQGKSLIFEKLF